MDATLAKKLSPALQDVADSVDKRLELEAGKRLSYVLIIDTDGIAQYVSNTARPDGVMMIESLLERWKANRADIPAHYNPDL